MGLLAGIALVTVLQNPVQLQAVEEIRIGSLFDESQALSRVAGAVTGPGRSIWIGQPQEPAVFVFDSTGTKIRVIGRAGAGPGEFRTISGLAGLGDSVLVSDGSLPRSTLFVGGRLDRTWPGIQLQDHTLLPRPVVGMLGNGEMIIVGGRLSRLPANELPIAILRPDRDGPRTIAWLDEEPARGVARDHESGLQMYFTPPIHAADLWAVVPGALAILRRNFPVHGDSTRAALTMLNSDGDTLSVVGFRGRSRPAPADFYESEVEALAQRASRGRPFPIELLRRMVEEAMPRPSRQPLFDRMVGGADVSVWLRESSAGQPMARWLIVDTSARAVVATVRVSADSELAWASRSEILTVESGEYDEPYVVRYRLVQSR